MPNYTFKTIEEALAGDYGRLFWASIRNGVLDHGDKASLYAKHLDEDLTFDIGNSSVLVNLDLKGTALNFTSYGESYNHDHSLEGVWVQTQSSITQNLSYKLRVGDKTYDFKELTGEYKMSLLSNVIPVAELFVDDRLEVKIVTFAPISADGSTRPRAAFYGIHIKNTSGSRVSGSIIPPQSAERITICAADSVELKPEMEFEIRSGHSYWLPLVIAAVPAEDAMSEIRKHGSVEWLRSTLSYFRSLTGQLNTPQDPYLGEFLARCIHQCVNSIVLTPDGDICGQHGWGTSPFRNEIWMKDFHYSFMPVVNADPEMARRGILWFAKHSVRFKGLLDGGVRHALVNSLAPVAMSGQYYAATADKGFFEEHPEVVERCKWLLDEALKLQEGDVFLLPSKLISDGPAWGDFHTGTNMFAWYCLEAFARLLESLGDKATADRYRDAARKIKTALPKHNIADGPFGKQYMEGVNKDGQLPTLTPWRRGVQDSAKVPLMGHDGEESDTTLASFYGFASYDDPPLHNRKKFALTRGNVLFTPDSDGVTWAYHGSTFPAYISGLSAVTDRQTMSGPDGYLTRIRKLTDLDGSLWWWPYTYDNSKYRIKDQPVRGLGKCGWASGVFACLFASQFLGLNYDAPSRILTFRPFLPTSDFTWNGFRVGDSTFSASFKREDSGLLLTVANHNYQAVNVTFKAILPKGKAAREIALDGVVYKGKVGEEAFFGSKVVVMEVKVKVGERAYLRVEY